MTKIFKHFDYKGITFPARDCIFEYKGKTIFRLIGSEVMSGMFFNEDGSFIDNDAENLDSKIDYYLPHDELMSLYDDEILNYIFRYIDKDILDDF